jgi:acyl-CoA oxidase
MATIGTRYSFLRR